MASEESHHSGSGDECEDDRSVNIAQVFAVTIGKTVWYPDVQTSSGTVYFKLAKGDRVLSKLILGKGVNRHLKKGDVRTISNRRWWSDVQKIRKEAMNMTYHHILRQTMEQAGTPPTENTKFRDARDDDRWLIRRSGVELTLPAVEGHEEIKCEALWQTKGDIWLELKPHVVEYCVAALKASDDIPKPSPKRKRKRKRDGSATPKGERKHAQPLPESPEADERREQHHPL